MPQLKTKLTKKAVIRRIEEDLANSCRSESDHIEAEAILRQWDRMPAAEVIAEAESVLGYTHAENGVAV